MNSLSNPPPPIAASAGSLPVDPVLRGYLLSEWRMHWAALRYLAPILGYEDRLPQKAN